jgi:hypothetical protein
MMDYSLGGNGGGWREQRVELLVAIAGIAVKT